MPSIPGDEGWYGYERTRRGEQDLRGVQADLRGASAGLLFVKEKSHVRPESFFMRCVIEQVMSLYRKRLSLLDQAAPVRKFLCGERLSTRGNHVKPL